MRELRFGKKRFDAVICLHGQLPKKTVFDELIGCKMLAADGAGIELIKIGIEPDCIIGDLDSFKSEPIAEKYDKSKIVMIEDQNTNDFEKCFLFAKDHEYRNILILGFHGGELEHSLNNWSVFMKYSKDMELCIYDKSRYGLPIRESINFEVPENEIVSIIPQHYAKLKTKNLKWSLNEEVLEFGIREGARNVAIKNNVQIELIEGEYLLFINERLPFAPSYEYKD